MRLIKKIFGAKSLLLLNPFRILLLLGVVHRVSLVPRSTLC